jgi:hypothetical protein
VLLGDGEEGAKAPFMPGRAKPVALLSVFCVAIFVPTLSVYVHCPGRTLFSLAQGSALAALVLGMTAFALFFLYFLVKDFLDFARVWSGR